MREYNYLQAIYMSFYSRNLYRDVADNWGGGVVLYLFFLLTLCWAVMMFKYQPAINLAAAQFAEKYVMQIPDVVIKDGQVSTPENRPYFIKDDTSNTVFAVIDSTGKYSNLQMAPQNTQLLITKDAFFYYDSHNILKMQKISQKFNMDFIPVKVKSLIERFAGWLWILILPFFLFVSFIYRLVQALVYAVIGKCFSLLTNIPLSYAKVLKLCMIAVTPAIIIGEVLDCCGVMFRFEWLLLFFISMVYLVFAIKANKHMDSQE